MSEFLPAWQDLAPTVALVTVATTLALLAAKRTPSAARRNGFLLPTLWLIALAPFAPLIGQALDLSFDVEVLAPGAPAPIAPTDHASGSLAANLETTTTAEAPAATPSPSSETRSPPSDRATRASASWPAMVVFAWAAGSVVALLALVLSLVRLRGLVRRSRPAPARLAAAVEHARHLVDLRRYPQLGVSDQITTPVAVGWGRRARVLLPTSSTETLSETEWIHALAHEGAHHAHGDPLLLVVRRLIRALWWWHPLVHRLDVELDRAREELADNAVLRSIDPLAYSETLLAWGRYTSSMPSTPLATSLLPRYDSLEARVRNLLTPRRCTMPRSRPLVLAAATLVAVSLCLAVGATRLAEQPTPTADAPSRAVDGAETGEWVSSFPDSDAPGHLDIDIKAGAIQVTGHDDDRVIVRWTVPRGPDPMQRFAKPIDLDIRTSGSTIEVNSDDYEQVTHLDVLVPRRTDLTLDSYRDGQLTVRNVQGDIRARSQNNDIVLDDVAGSADVYGYNGSFSASFTEVDGDLSFETYNGHVRLTFPDDVGLATQLRTDRGSLRSTFQLNDTSGSIGRSSRTKGPAPFDTEPYARATIGDGEHSLTIETTNGDIELLRQSDAARD